MSSQKSWDLQLKSFIFIKLFLYLHRMKTDTSNMIKNLRRARNLTQEQLGVLSGMTKSQISRMEKGVLGSPETVDRLLEAMGYSLEVKVVDKYETPDGERQKVLNTLGNFKKYNSAKYGIESMALFGSFSRGEQNEGSDVDVLISLKEPSLFLFAEIQAALESVLKRSVDLVSEKSRKREGFNNEIAKDLIYV